MNRHLFLVVLGIVLYTSLLGQTTTIDYSAASLGSNCNVFNPGVNVNSIPHQSLAGGVSYSSSNGIILSTVPAGPAAGGTAYVIQYNFESNYNYTVAITAIGDNTVYLKATVVPNLAQFTSTSTSSCTPDASVTGYSTVGTGNISVQPPATSTTYTSSQFSGTGQQNLVIWGTGGPSNLNLDNIIISKIVITKAPPPASFTLPSTTNVTCGSNTPVTFAVTNVNGTQGISDYTWNLGATPNGWLYNGSAAPASVSTGITGSIALTPVCGSTPGNVNATVTANGNTYITNTSTINVMAPDLSITGISNVCSSSPYSVNNLPSCNASVTWDVSNANIATLSCKTCNSTTLTKRVDGTVTLTATITNTNACGNGTTVKTMTVNTGIPVLTSATYTYNGSQNTLQYYTGSSSYNPLCTSQNTDVNATFSGASTVTWSKVSSSNTVAWTQSGNDINFYLWGAGQTAVFNVDASNSCGDVSYNFGFQDFDCGSGGGCAKYIVSKANQSSLRVVKPTIPPPCRVMQTKEEKDSFKNEVISQVKIYDMSGRLRLSSRFGNVQEALVNTSGLLSGVYLIEISNGKTWEKQMVRIMR